MIKTLHHLLHRNAAEQKNKPTQASDLMTEAEAQSAIDLIEHLDELIDQDGDRIGPTIEAGRDAILRIARAALIEHDEQGRRDWIMQQFEARRSARQGSARQG